MRKSEIFLRTLIEFQGQAHHLGTNGPVMLTGGHGGTYLQRKAPASGSVMAVEVRYEVGSLSWAWWQKAAGTSTDPPLCVAIPCLPWLLFPSMTQSTGWLSMCKRYWRIQSRTGGCGRGSDSETCHGLRTRGDATVSRPAAVHLAVRALRSITAKVEETAQFVPPFFDFAVIG